VLVEPQQSQRIARLTTPLGAETLVLSRFDGEEGLSSLFEFQIEALSTSQNLDFTPALGRHCSVTFESYGEKRHFDGILTEARWVGLEQAAYHAYRLTLRPWLWLLGRKADCRIFRDKTPIDILEDVFQRGAFNDFDIKAERGDYERLEYCVQYRETDLAFVSRLMEQWGLYTFHEHEAGRHTLVIADGKSCHSPVKTAGGSIPFVALAGADQPTAEHLRIWEAERRFRTGRMALNDFDYMKPAAKMQVEAQGNEGYERSKLEVYDYPGRYLEPPRGERFARVRLQAEQALDHRKHAAGDAISLLPGRLARLKGHPTDDREYLVVAARHSFALEAYRTGATATGPGEAYRGSYELQPSDIPYRAPIVTPRPIVHGPQTAMVVTRKGNEGEEIDVDEEGRIFVQFHWNRERDKISRPVRVAQMWAGKQWGWQVIPRVGQEVVVEFLEGNPDQPLVVGTVYNKNNRFPYPLPDEKTVSGVKSDSSKGHEGFNEFVFDDRKGGELVRMRAERDHETLVRRSETRTIGESLAGGTARTTTIKNGDDRLVLETGSWNVGVAEVVEISAGSRLVLKVGASRIVMEPTRIRIEAGDIAITGVASLVLASANLQVG
jgi:type VI secretion system secreted protein VgrG